jgi:hypothetical protein
MGVAKFTRQKRRRGVSGLSQVVQRRIEAERRRLQKASAVLTALVSSLSAGLDSELAADLASVTRDLVEQANLALDVVVLKGK